MPIDLFITEPQREVVESTARFIGVFAGRRWGKTDTWFNRATRLLLTTRCFNYTYIAPSYSQVKDQYERMRRHLAAFIKRAVGQPRPQIEFHTGSRIQFRSFDRPRLIRGSGENEVWVDEIQDIQEEPYDAVVVPLVADRRGTLGVSGQFRGHNWYFKRFYQNGQDPTRPLYASWRFPTRTGIRFLGPEGEAEIENIKSNLPRSVYLQEYECEPIANQAAVFDPQDVQAAYTGAPPPPPNPRSYYIGALDLGWKKDYSVGIVLDHEFRVVDLMQAPLGMKHSDQAPRFAPFFQKWRCDPVVVDTTGGATGGRANKDEHIRFYRQWIKQMRDFTWTRDNKARLVKHTEALLNNRQIKLPGTPTDPYWPVLDDELLNYEFKYRNGIYELNAAPGKHDDAVTALCIAAWGISQEWINKRGGRIMLG